MSPLTQVQENGAAILRSDAFFSDHDEEKALTVFTQKKGDLESEIKQKIESLGLSVVVLTPLGKLPDPSVDDVVLDVPLIVQITEDPVLNKTGKGALDVVCETICLLCGAPTGLSTKRTDVFRLSEIPFSLVDESPTYHVNLIAQVTLTPRRAAGGVIRHLHEPTL